MKQIRFVAFTALACMSLIACEQATELCIDESKRDASLGCILVYDPVCGCDGETYGNSCEADRQGVQYYVDGECP